jgi:hypothetical protein
MCRMVEGLPHRPATGHDARPQLGPLGSLLQLGLAVTSRRCLEVMDGHGEQHGDQ